MQRGNLADAKKNKPFLIIPFILRRAPLLLAIGLPSFFLLLVLFKPFEQPVYSTDARILITPSKAPTITGRERDLIQGDVAWFARTLVLRLTNPEILRATLRKLPDEERPVFLRGLGDSDRAVFRLFSRLKAQEVARTYIIRVTIQAGEAYGLAKTLNTLLDTFLEKLESEQEQQYRAQLDFLKSERDRTLARLSEEAEGLTQITNELGSSVFLNQNYQGHLEKLNQIQSLYWKAEGNALNLLEQLQQARRNKEEITKLSIEPFADAEVANFLGINQMEQWTYVETQELRKTIDGLTADNPDRKNVESRMAAMIDYLEKYKTKVASDMRRTLTEKREYELEEEIIRAKNASEAAQATLDTLRTELERAQREASKVSEAMFRASNYSFGLQRFRERLFSIENRIYDATMEAKAPLPVLIEQYALQPERPASTNGKTLTLLALALAFGAPFGICLVFDFLDPRIRLREEIAAAIGGPGCEPVPALLGNGAEANVIPLSNDHPFFIPIRDLAVRLLLENQRAQARVIALVGAHARAGTTTITLSLCRALAAHGMRVLAVELPNATPGMQNLAGIPSKTFLPSGAWAAKVPDPHSACDLIPWVPGTPTDAIRTTADKFLISARGSYDLVVLDCQPIWQSDISHELAVKSDVAVVIAKQDVAQYADVRRAVDWLVAGKIPALTALLNFHQPLAVMVFLSRLFQSSMNFISFAHRVSSKVVRQKALQYLQTLAQKVFPQKNK